MKLSYRMLFILVMMMFGFLFLGFYSVTYYFQHSIDVSDVSTKHFQDKSEERLKYIDFFLERFPKTIRAIEDNPDFQQYVKTGDNPEAIENLFLSLQRSVTCTMQIRYLDMQGMELVRTDAKGTHQHRSPTSHRVVPKEQLQDKSHRPYFQNFKKLPEGQLGISSIELNMEHDKIVEPKQPTMRFAKVIYKDGQAQGMIIINVCLTKFFQQLQKTTLYHIYLVDHNGRFLLYKDSDKSLIGSQFNHFSIYEAFGLEVAKKILENSSYAGSHVYSTPVPGLARQQEVKLVMELKFNELSQQVKDNANLMMWMIIITILLMMPIAVYLSRFPDTLMKKLDQQAHKDALTSLPNKTSLFEDMEQQDNQILILLRIDNLRAINNVYGYLFADQLIQKMGEKLTELCQQHELKAYKLPSNVFALAVDYQDRPHLTQLMDQIHNEIEGQSFNVNEHEFSLTVTLGACDPDTTVPLTEMIIDAEKAMHEAINQKLDYAILDTQVDLKRQHQQNIQILDLIRHALNNHQVMGFYQPIFNNQTQNIDKYEVLMRLKDDKGIIYPPNTFLDIAKASKYYHRLTREIVIQSMAFFKDHPHDFSINISFEDIMHDDFFEFLSTEVQKYKLCHRVVIEIVETEGLGDYTQVYDFIKNVKQMGCRIAIDDFGTGYSNFEHLLRLHQFIDYVKIDGSLIKNIVESETNQAIVKNIKTFCDDMGIQTIAEFVSEEAIQIKVMELGIHYSQGYHFGQPHNELLNYE